LRVCVFLSKEQLRTLAGKGLRTLVFGYREISLKEWEKCCQLLKETRSSFHVEDEISQVYDSLEQNLTLVGCTGILDQLQPEVPDVIENLKHANIKTWVLTGDKLETAVSIGKACSILSDDTYNCIINGATEKEVLRQMQTYMSFIIAGQVTGNAFNISQYNAILQVSSFQLQGVFLIKPF
jgi:magnesium-transporting ATPase (P-type)